MANWTDRDQAVLWHPYTQMKTAAPPIPVVRGEGAYLIDEANRRYFDGISSWWTSLHGHSHPEIAAAIAKQAQELEHVIFAGFTHRPAIQLAEKVLSLLPGNQKRVFFSDNGSTAVEVAMKMAIQYWANIGQPGRNRIICLNGGYHGDTFGAMSVSEPGLFTNPFQSLLFATDRIPFPSEENEIKGLEDFEVLLKRGDSAALIVEPLIQGVAGMRMAQPESFDRLITLAHQYGCLVIADEVMTGFYRTGRAFASSYLIQSPDLFCLSKGLTGGTLALGATTCTAEIFEAFFSEDRSKTLFHGHSFTANPIACAAGLASSSLLETAECQARILRISELHRDFVKRIMAEPRFNSKISNPRSRGTIVAFECQPSPGKGGYLDPIGPQLSRFFLERDLLLRPLGNTVYVLPPYCSTNQELLRIYDVIFEGLEKHL